MGILGQRDRYVFSALIECLLKQGLPKPKAFHKRALMNYTNAYAS